MRVASSSLLVSIVLSAALGASRSPAVAADGCEEATTHRDAPAALAVGAADVSGSFLSPYDNVWRYGVTTMTDGVYHFQGLWTDHLERLDRDGRALLQRTQGLTFADGRVTSFVNVFDPATMAPVSSEQRDPDGSFQHRDFAGARVAFRRLPAGGKESHGAVALDGAVFDFAGGMYGLLLAALPQRSGYVATVPTIDEHEERLVPLTVRVLRQESVAAGHLGHVDAWVVQTDDEAAGRTMTFWLTRQAPYVIKVTLTGPRGNIASWEMR